MNQGLQVRVREFLEACIMVLEVSAYPRPMREAVEKRVERLRDCANPHL
jgi:hypothetical protein